MRIVLKPLPILLLRLRRNGKGVHEMAIKITIDNVTFDPSSCTGVVSGSVFDDETQAPVQNSPVDVHSSPLGIVMFPGGHGFVTVTTNLKGVYRATFTVNRHTPSTMVTFEAFTATGQHSNTVVQPVSCNSGYISP